MERAAAVLPARAPAALGTLASIGLAIFPKCPVCWAAYLSTFGIAGLERFASAAWIQPVLAGAVLLNMASVWFRARSTRRLAGAALVTAGAGLIALSRFGWPVAVWGVAATAAGSIISALRR